MVENDKVNKPLPGAKKPSKAAVEESEDSDCGLEFVGGAATQSTEAKNNEFSFKSLLASKKISFTEKFGKEAAMAPYSTDLSKRRKTLLN